MAPHFLFLFSFLQLIVSSINITIVADQEGQIAAETTTETNKITTTLMDSENTENGTQSILNIENDNFLIVILLMIIALLLCICLCCMLIRIMYVCRKDRIENGYSSKPIDLGKVSSISSADRSQYVTPSPPPRMIKGTEMVNSNSNNNQEAIISIDLPPPPPAVNDKEKVQKRRATVPELPESDDSDADPSLYRLQHQYLENEVNEDEDEREAMLLDDKNALKYEETLQHPTDDGQGPLTKGQKQYLIEDSMTKEEEDEYSKNTEIYGMTTTGGYNGDDAKENENVPPPPLPPQ